jgi:hypothetical protein
MMREESDSSTSVRKGLLVSAYVIFVVIYDLFQEKQGLQS